MVTLFYEYSYEWSTIGPIERLLAVPVSGPDNDDTIYDLLLSAAERVTDVRKTHRYLTTRNKNLSVR